jgi:hypothetical protein
MAVIGAAYDPVIVAIVAVADGAAKDGTEGCAENAGGKRVKIGTATIVEPVIVPLAPVAAIVAAAVIVVGIAVTIGLDDLLTLAEAQRDILGLDRGDGSHGHGGGEDGGDNSVSCGTHLQLLLNGRPCQPIVA